MLQAPERKIKSPTSTLLHLAGPTSENPSIQGETTTQRPAKVCAQSNMT